MQADMPQEDMLTLLEAGRRHLLELHGDDRAIDMARSFEDTIRNHARWLAHGRELQQQLVDQVDNLRSSSERRQDECLWCCDIACEAAEALIVLRGEGVDG
jgi:hypothetical protein